MRPTSPRRLSTLAAALLMALPGLASAQSLQEVYDAARAFDATYLAAKANASSAQYKAEQVEALARPSLAATASATTSQTDPPNIGSKGTNNLSGALNGKYPLFNRANDASI